MIKGFRGDEDIFKTVGGFVSDPRDRLPLPTIIEKRRYHRRGHTSLETLINGFQLHIKAENKISKEVGFSAMSFGDNSVQY